MELQNDFEDMVKRREIRNGMAECRESEGKRVILEFIMCQGPSS